MNEERFLIIEFDSDVATPRLCTEHVVSNRIDMADCYNEPYKIYYVTKKGKIVKLKYGEERRININEEFPLRFAVTDMIAEDNIVGEIVHTDH